MRRGFPDQFARSVTSTCDLERRIADQMRVSAGMENTGALQAAESFQWQSINLAGMSDLLELLRKSDAFDAGVPGVSHMLGGQSAGYARWDSFKKSGLAQYAARRNNAMQRCGHALMQHTAGYKHLDHAPLFILQPTIT